MHPLLMALVMLLLASCQSTPGDGNDAAFDDTNSASRSSLGRSKRRAATRPKKSRPFFKGSKEMQAHIARDIAAFATADTMELNSINRRLIGRGEISVPKLLRALRHNDPKVRMRSAFVLGMIRDVRSLDALASTQRDPHEGVAYEAATALARSKDDRGLPKLIAGLSHPSSLIRARCIQVLKETTGETQRFVANDREEDRSAAVARWDAWLERRRHELYEHRLDNPPVRDRNDDNGDFGPEELVPGTEEAVPANEPETVKGYGSPDG